MAKCNGVSFWYRGTSKRGHELAELLSEMSVNCELPNGGGWTIDLGSLLVYVREASQRINHEA